MKVLLVQDTDWIKRNPIQHNHLVERLVLKGHEVRVIDYDILWRTDGKKGLFSKKQIFEVSRILNGANHTVIRPRIIRIPILDYFSMFFTYTTEIRRQILNFCPDVIYADTILTAYLATRLAKQHNIKIIYYCIDVCYRLMPFGFLRPIGKFVESSNMKSADLVFSINKKLQDYTIRMGASPEKTIMLRAGVDCNIFKPGLDNNDIRHKYGLGNDDITLFFVGWLYHFSGLKEVAIELSRTTNKKIKLFIVGDGDAFDELNNIRKTYGLEDRMILVGKQPYAALPGLMSIADIFLLPAYDNEIMHDIVPIKMYEYLAMGKPVIVTKLPGIIAEFGDGNGVIYVDKPEDAVFKALEVLSNGEAAKIGIQARRFVEQNSWDTITNDFEKYLKEVIQANG